jgi:zona occludens toxin
MAINVYTGLMGSGKSYECVSSVILPAIRAGRRVVSNISGLDNDLIRAYCSDKHSVPLDKLGHVVHVSNDDVSSPSFFPFGQPVDTLCQPGDLVCIDEAWRFWGTSSKLDKNHQVFFREHRHYCHPDTGVSCDLVLMVQDISDLHRVLKVVVEMSFRTTKIKSLGLSRVYRVEWWESYRMAARARLGVQNKRYDPAIFPLYQSYDATHKPGTETQVDKRQNVLRNPWIYIIGLSVLSAGVWGAIHLHAMFDPPPPPAPSPLSSSSHAGSLPPPAPRPPSPSAQWRIVGRVFTGTSHYVLLAAPDGRIRLADPSEFQLSGDALTGTIDGQPVYYWSGAPPMTAPRHDPSPVPSLP